MSISHNRISRLEKESGVSGHWQIFFKMGAAGLVEEVEEKRPPGVDRGTVEWFDFSEFDVSDDDFVRLVGRARLPSDQVFTILELSKPRSYIQLLSANKYS